MATPLLDEQALASLAPLFHDEFGRFRREFMQPGENVFAVTECSSRGFAEAVSGGYFGFFVLAAERAFSVTYKAYHKREQIRFYQEGQGFFYHVLPDETILGLSPSSPLLNSEIETRQVQEVLLSMIEGIDRSAYSATVDDYLFQCIELNFKGSGRGPDGWLGSVGVWRTLFEAKDGHAIYNLIQSTIHGGGQIEATVSRDEMLQRLERLATLYQAGMLTEDEFQIGKKRLLGM